MITRNYTKAEAIKVITSTAKEYRQKLEGMNCLFIFRNREDDKVDYFESLFLPRNYQHLTGIDYVRDGIVVREPVRFYHACVDGRISAENIRFREDGTTPLKLEALPKIVSFINASRMTGLYNGVRPRLAVDRIAGTTNFCLGFTKDGDYYVPSSCLLEDIRDLSDRPSRVLAVMSKKSDDAIYRDIRYVAKGLPFDKLALPDVLEAILDRTDYRK